VPTDLHLQLNASSHHRFACRCNLEVPSDWLTSNTALTTFNVMFALGGGTRLRILRAVSVAALLFVFSLPLHFHFTSVGQVAKECVCVHGTRTQLAPLVDSPTLSPSLQATLFAAPRVSTGGGDWSIAQKVRGPPSTISG
jgi:hypothetical protein